MSTKANMLPRRVRDTYEVKLRRPGDRINGNGQKVEGGKTFSRHFEANNTKHAETVASKIAKKQKAVIIGMFKVHHDDVIGDFRTWGLEGIIGVPKKADVILDNMSLDEIVFKKKKKK